jgi:hypothetical protein
MSPLHKSNHHAKRTPRTDLNHKCRRSYPLDEACPFAVRSCSLHLSHLANPVQIFKRKTMLLCKCTQRQQELLILCSCERPSFRCFSPFIVPPFLQTFSALESQTNSIHITKGAKALLGQRLEDLVCRWDTVFDALLYSCPHITLPACHLTCTRSSRDKNREQRNVNVRRSKHAEQALQKAFRHEQA